MRGFLFAPSHWVGYWVLQLLHKGVRHFPAARSRSGSDSCLLQAGLSGSDTTAWLALHNERRQFRSPRPLADAPSCKDGRESVGGGRRDRTYEATTEWAPRADLDEQGLAPACPRGRDLGLAAAVRLPGRGGPLAPRGRGGRRSGSRQPPHPRRRTQRARQPRRDPRVRPDGSSVRSSSSTSTRRSIRNSLSSTTTMHWSTRCG